MEAPREGRGEWTEPVKGRTESGKCRGNKNLHFPNASSWNSRSQKNIMARKLIRWKLHFAANEGKIQAHMCSSKCLGFKTTTLVKLMYSIFFAIWFLFYFLLKVWTQWMHNLFIFSTVMSINIQITVGFGLHTSLIYNFLILSEYCSFHPLHRLIYETLSVHPIHLIRLKRFLPLHFGRQRVHHSNFTAGNYLPSAISIKTKTCTSMRR